jgi:hypothetical protein
MNVCGEVEIWLHECFTSALNKYGHLQAPAALTQRRNPWIRGCVGPQAGLVVMRKRKICPSVGNRTLIQPVVGLFAFLSGAILQIFVSCVLSQQRHIRNTSGTPPHPNSQLAPPCSPVMSTHPGSAVWWWWTYNCRVQRVAVLLARNTDLVYNFAFV